MRIRILKIVDQYIILRFISPFIASFFIALFVLIMQFLWKSIKHFAGKGLSFWSVMEIISYLSVSMMPMAMPIGVLLSSVMVFGGMAEKFELSGLKSAGISFVRLSQSALWFCLFLSVFSFALSNNIIPVVNLKFYSRMYDIRHSKPALSLEAKEFNQDFKNYVIYVGDKDEDNQSIQDLIIYDKELARRKVYNSLSAKDGKMYTSDDDKFFVMELYDGHRYEEMKPGEASDAKYPFTKTSFNKWKKSFDLGEFNIQETDQKLFTHHRYMLTIGQISADTDTALARQQRQLDRLRVREQVPALRRGVRQVDRDQKNNVIDIQKPQDKVRQKALKRIQDRRQDLDSLASGFLATFNSERRRQMVFTGNSQAKSLIKRLESTASKSLKTQEVVAKNTYEVHNKIANSLMCMIFLLIGAPMGAIVRKGGYGISLLIAIVFFVFYIMTSILLRKTCFQLAMDPALAAWLSPAVLTLVGIFLTLRASRDSKILDFSGVTRVVRKTFLRKIGD